MLATQENEPDLRAVPVGDDDAETALDQIDDVARGLNHCCILVSYAPVFVVFDEGIAADGDDNGLHGPGFECSQNIPEHKVCPVNCMAQPQKKLPASQC